MRFALHSQLFLFFHSLTEFLQNCFEAHQFFGVPHNHKFLLCSLFQWRWRNHMRWNWRSSCGMWLSATIFSVIFITTPTFSYSYTRLDIARFDSDAYSAYLPLDFTTDASTDNTIHSIRPTAALLGHSITILVQSNQLRFSLRFLFFSIDENKSEVLWRVRRVCFQM